MKITPENEKQFIRVLALMIQKDFLLLRDDPSPLLSHSSSGQKKDEQKVPQKDNKIDECHKA